jgi:ABC-type polar amino acid transport system ATPase subunit
VSKWFSAERVLTDVSLALSTGERLVICGPSGSGKSTLLRCINGLDDYDEGSIIVNGMRVTRQSKTLERVRSDAGMVFQAFNLFAHLTALENCTLAPMKVRGLTRPQAEAAAIQFLDRVHMKRYLGSYPSELSGGQQQRVAIARALCMQPRVIMFDEPTSSLDPEMTKEVLDIILDLSRSGMTMICVTHEIPFAQQIADRVMFIDRGQVIEEGTPNALFQQPRSERLKIFLNQVLHHRPVEG